MTLFQISYHWVWGFFKPTSKKMWTYQCKWISNFIETNASSLVLYGCENSLISYINRPVFQWVAQVFHLSHPNWVSLYVFHIVLYKFPIALAKKIFNENQLTECSLLWNHKRDFKIERATTDEWVKYEWSNNNVRNKNCIDYWKLTVALGCGNL